MLQNICINYSAKTSVTRAISDIQKEHGNPSILAMTGGIKEKSGAYLACIKTK